MPSQSVGLHPGSNRLNRGDQLFDAGFELSWLGHEGSEREIEAVQPGSRNWLHGALVHRCVFRFSDHIELRFKVLVSSQFGSPHAVQTPLCLSPSDPPGRSSRL